MYIYNNNNIYIHIHILENSGLGYFIARVDSMIIVASGMGRN
jgi:hypothetical protein